MITGVLLVVARVAESDAATGLTDCVGRLRRVATKHYRVAVVDSSWGCRLASVL